MAMKEDARIRAKIANPRGLPIVEESFAVDPADNVTGYKSFQAGSFELPARRIFRLY